jgi:hypothetical protein
VAAVPFETFGSKSAALHTLQGIYLKATNTVTSARFARECLSDSLA